MHPSASAAFAAFASTASISAAATFTAFAALTSTSNVPPLPPPPPMRTSASASDRKPHRVNLFRTWIYYLTVPFPQSVTDSLMEPDQEGDGGGRRGNPKERMPERGTEPTE
jgi:hypothetical protein